MTSDPTSLTFEETKEGHRYTLSGMELVNDCTVERVGDELMEVEYKDRRYDKYQIRNLIKNSGAILSITTGS